MSAWNEQDLVAYADGRLDRSSARGQALSRDLSRDAESAHRVRDYAAQDAALREHFNAVLAEPIPAALQPRQLRRQPPRDRRPQVVAGLALAAGVGALAIALSLRPAAEDPLSRFSEQVVSVIDEGQGVPMSAQATRNAPIGNYLPVAQRRLQLEGAAMEEVQYQDGSGRRLRLFIGAPGEFATPGVQWRSTREGSLMFWRQDDRLFALSGDLPEPELGAVAAQLMGEPATAEIPQVADAAEPQTQGPDAVPGNTTPAELRPAIETVVPALGGEALPAGDSL